MPPHDPPSDDDLLTPKEVAAILQISTKTLKRWDDAGLLPRPRFEVGATKRYARGEILAWLRLGVSRPDLSAAKRDRPGPHAAK